MKSKLIYGIIVLTIIGIILISGCVRESKKETVTCNSPYIKVGTTCCLDQNSNNICDKDEAPTQTQRQEQKPQTYCGDDICQSDESCSSCPSDCGECAPPPKKYGENQIAGCEEEYIQIGKGTKTTRDECYRYHGIKEENYFYCDQIRGQSEKNYCYYQVAQLRKNTYVCELISTTTSNCGNEQFNCKDTCYHDIAIKKVVVLFVKTSLIRMLRIAVTLVLLLGKL